MPSQDPKAEALPEWPIAPLDEARQARLQARVLSMIATQTASTPSPPLGLERLKALGVKIIDALSGDKIRPTQGLYGLKPQWVGGGLMALGVLGIALFRPLPLETSYSQGSPSVSSQLSSVTEVKTKPETIGSVPKTMATLKIDKASHGTLVPLAEPEIEEIDPVFGESL